jgi:hypothetical protein
VGRGSSLHRLERTHPLPLGPAGITCRLPGRVVSTDASLGFWVGADDGYAKAARVSTPRLWRFRSYE